MLDSPVKDAAQAPSAVRGHAHHASRASAVGVPQGNDVGVARVHPRREDGGFVGFGAAARKKAVLQASGCELSDLLRDFNRDFVDVERRGVLHLEKLLDDRRCDLFVGVTYRHGEDAAEEVEIFVTFYIPDELVFGVRNG